MVCEGILHIPSVGFEKAWLANPNRFGVLYNLLESDGTTWPRADGPLCVRPVLLNTLRDVPEIGALDS